MEKEVANRHDEKQELKRKVFNVPTAITKLKPIFSIEFNLKHEAHVTIRLNPELGLEPTSINGQSYPFNNDGYCSFNHKDIKEYFIKGDVKLLCMNCLDEDSDEMSHCQMSITYGKEKSELFYLKGTFKLSDF